MAETTPAAEPQDATPNVSDVEVADVNSETEAVAALDAPVERGEPILQVRNLVKHFPRSSTRARTSPGCPGGR
jgi:oligopeptide transport system ATP-binding protein